MNDNTNDRWRWAIGATVVLVLGVFGAITYLASHDPGPGKDNTGTITLLLGLASTTVVALLALLKTQDTSRDLQANTKTTERTAQLVSELGNGSMDAKIRLAVAQVLAPDALHNGPLVARQLEADRRRVAQLDALAAELAQRVKDE